MAHIIDLGEREREKKPSMHKYTYAYTHVNLFVLHTHIKVILIGRNMGRQKNVSWAICFNIGFVYALHAYNQFNEKYVYRQINAHSTH